MATALDRISLFGIVGMSLIGLLVNVVAVRFASLDALALIEGCPIWSWYLGFFIQAVIYPGIVFLGFREKGYDLHAWLQV